MVDPNYFYNYIGIDDSYIIYEGAGGETVCYVFKPVGENQCITFYDHIAFESDVGDDITSVSDVVINNDLDSSLSYSNVAGMGVNANFNYSNYYVTPLMIFLILSIVLSLFGGVFTWKRLKRV